MSVGPWRKRGYGELTVTGNESPYTVVEQTVKGAIEVEMVADVVDIPNRSSCVTAHRITIKPGFIRRRDTGRFLCYRSARNQTFFRSCNLHIERKIPCCWHLRWECPTVERRNYRIIDSLPVLILPHVEVVLPIAKIVGVEVHTFFSSLIG